jgi:hypothetical protein
MTLLDSVEAATARDGVVGKRQLVCVQTVDIARLTHHPVPITAGTFVAVGGRGPKNDSNESGKTSFLAATALLLGDTEWRMSGSGAAGAAALLFEPATAGVAAHVYTPAREGYVIGVFADPDAVQATAMTVWLRIQAAAPYVTVRWIDGVRLIDEPTQAAGVWGELGSGNESGSRGYVERLFGDSPRCLAYVAKRGTVRSEASLLQMDAGAFSPNEIGQQLIALTGRGSLFNAERESRSRLHEANEKLAAKIADSAAADAAEDAQLAGVHARNDARHYLHDAERHWRLHFAQGLVQVTQRQDELEELRIERRCELADAETRARQADEKVGALADPGELRRLAGEAATAAADAAAVHRTAIQSEADARAKGPAARELVRSLRDASEGWDGRTAGECATANEVAHGDLTESDRAHASASDHLRHVTAELEAARAGNGGAGGELAARLRGAGIDAAGFVDVIDVDEGQRHRWEARLAPWTAAALISDTDLDEATAVVADLPGSVLVHGDPADTSLLPDGLDAAPANARRFLNELAARTSTPDDPHRAADAAGVVVIGGWRDPQLGRQARITAAEAEVNKATEALEAAERDLAGNTNASAIAEAALRRAEAGEALPAAEGARQEIETEISDAARAVAAAETEVSTTDEKRIQTASDLAQYDALLNSAKAEATLARATEAACTQAVTDVDQDIRQLYVEYWETGWGGTVDTARAHLDGEVRGSRTLQNRASELLNDALGAIGIRSGGEGAPSPELESVAARRPSLAETPERGKRAAPFEEVVAPLRDWLDLHADRDVMIEERIASGRQQRAEEQRLAEDECGQIERSLTDLQDGIEARIDQALRDVASEYDRLDRAAGGFGATLDIVSRRPDGPSDPWLWEVTPKWRRSRDGNLLSYTHQANTAQEKQQTVHLVLAALLSAPNPQGRVLILDELGDSLGVQHRREVLAAIGECALNQGITVLGTCQDSVLVDAAAYCGELLYFEYASKSDVLNHPVRAFGFDPNGDRVRLTADQLVADRPLV